MRRQEFRATTATLARFLRARVVLADDIMPVDHCAELRLHVVMNERTLCHVLSPLSILKHFAAGNWGGMEG